MSMLVNEQLSRVDNKGFSFHILYFISTLYFMGISLLKLGHVKSLADN